MRTTRQSNAGPEHTIVACVTVAVLALVAAPSLRAQGDEVEPGRLVQGDPDPPVAPAVGDGYGSRVSVSGDTAVVGALGKDDAGTDSGAVYVFERPRQTRISGHRSPSSRRRMHVPAWVSGQTSRSTVTRCRCGRGSTELGELVGAAYVFQRDPSAQTCGRRWRFSGATKCRENALVQVSPSTMIRPSLANQVSLVPHPRRRIRLRAQSRRHRYLGRDSEAGSE